MILDKAAYHDLEQRFRDQVQMDRAHAIKRVVEGWGIYLPCKEPENQVDYVFVGMEPSFGWARDMDDAEKKIAEGFRNFDRLNNDNDMDPFVLFRRSIEQFLCRPGETYHLTDVSKGAMPVTVAALDRDRRYREWYSLLLEEIGIVGKPGAPIIAMGKEVEAFLRKRNIQKETSRRLFGVLHYSRRAFPHWKAEAEKDQKGFEEFRKGSPWVANLPDDEKYLVFTYKKQFAAIMARGSG